MIVCNDSPVEGVFFAESGTSTWGISCNDIGIAGGSTLTDAVLVFDGIRRSDPATSLRITLLRNPALGFQNASSPPSEELDLATIGTGDLSDRIVLFFSGINDPHSTVWTVFRRPFVMPLSDGSRMEYSSAVLELMDILGTENTFGLGFHKEGTGTIEIGRISLQLSIHPYKEKGNPITKTYSLIQEEFSSGSMIGWSILDQGTLYTPSVWSVINGQFRQDNNTCQQDLNASVDMLGTHAIFQPSRRLSDFQMAVSLHSEDDDAIGILFRYRDPANYYRFSWDLQRRVRRLVKCVNGKYSILAQDAVGYEIGKTYRVAIVARGPQFAVAIDGTPVFHARDSEISDGAIGLYCCAQQGAVFDDVRIEGATKQTFRLMAPIGHLEFTMEDSIRIPITPAIPIPSVRYWFEPTMPRASLENEVFLWQPLPSEAGTHFVRFLAESDNGFDSQTAVIQIRSVNHPPHIHWIGPQRVIEGDTLILAPQVTDPDGDSVHLSCSPLPIGAMFSNNQLVWTPTHGQTGDYSIVFQAFDGSLGSSQLIEITVLPNHPPVFGFLNPVVIAEGSEMALAIPVSDPDEDQINLKVENGPAGMSVKDQILIWKPDYSQAGHYSITITANDGMLDSRMVLPIMVLHTNRPPDIGNIPSVTSVMTGRFLSISIPIWDPDGDAVKLSSPNLPSGAILSDHNLTWMPGTIQSGLYDIEIVVSDGAIDSSKWIEIRVL